jgi:MFS family permease
MQLTKNLDHVAMTAGLAFSVTGMANIIAAPFLGRLSDRTGAHKVILLSLIAAGIFYIPQAFVQSPGQLIALRFLLGFTMGGLAPAVNTLIKKITPSSHIGRIFGLTMSAQYLGIFGGSVLGGQIAAAFGIPAVLFVTSALMLLNAMWVYFYVYKRMEGRE